MNITTNQITQMQNKLNGNSELILFVYGNNGQQISRMTGPIQLLVDESGAEPCLRIEGGQRDVVINLTDLDGMVVAKPDEQVDSVIAGNPYFKFLSTMTDWITGENWAVDFLEGWGKAYFADLELQIGEVNHRYLVYWSNIFQAKYLNVPTISFVGSTLWVEIRGLWTARNLYLDNILDFWKYINGTANPHDDIAMGETTLQFHLNNLKFFRLSKVGSIDKFLVTP